MSDLQQKLDVEVQQLEALVENVNVVEENLVTARQEMLFRQGRISILKEQIEAEEGDAPDEPEPKG